MNNVKLREYIGKAFRERVVANFDYRVVAKHHHVHEGLANLERCYVPLCCKMR